MKRLLVLIPAVLMAVPAFAQTAPEGSYRDLWCGLAFGAAAQGAPFTEADLAAARAAGDAATDEQKQIIEQQNLVDQFNAGSTDLIDKATTAYKGAGFTDESFGQVRTDLEPRVTAQITGTAGEPEFSFEECSALIPALDAGAAGATEPAEAAPAADATATTTAAPANDAMTSTTATAPATPDAPATTTTSTTTSTTSAAPVAGSATTTSTAQ